MLARFSYILKLIIVIIISGKVLGEVSCFADEDIRLMISRAEVKYAIPRGLLHAIANVESSNNPYAINVAGRNMKAKSQEEAVKIINSYISQCHTNIDIGLMQINYHYHSKNFTNVRTMLALEENIEYGAKLLSELYKKHGSWNKAVRHYHSATFRSHRKYANKVLVVWLGG